MNLNQVGGVDTVSSVANNMKARINNSPEETVNAEEKNMKDALSNPMETIGRSQVNFKGIKHLSAQDLNHISEYVAKTKLGGEDITTLKKTLIKILNKEDCKTLKEVVVKSGGGEEAYLDFVQDVMSEASKINKNVDVDKIGSTASEIFLLFEKF